MTTTITLVEPTIFPDLNKSQEQPENFARSEIQVSRLKYKHLRHMQTLSEDKQMTYAISSLTGLSNDDMDELDAEDAAKITTVIYGFMEKFMQLAGSVPFSWVT